MNFQEKYIVFWYNTLYFDFWDLYLTELLVDVEIQGWNGYGETYNLGLLMEINKISDEFEIRANPTKPLMISMAR